MIPRKEIRHDGSGRNTVSILHDIDLDQITIRFEIELYGKKSRHIPVDNTLVLSMTFLNCKGTQAVVDSDRTVIFGLSGRSTSTCFIQVAPEMSVISSGSTVRGFAIVRSLSEMTKFQRTVRALDVCGRKRPALSTSWATHFNEPCPLSPGKIHVLPGQLTDD